MHRDALYCCVCYMEVIRSYWTVQCMALSADTLMYGANAYIRTYLDVCVDRYFIIMLGSKCQWAQLANWITDCEHVCQLFVYRCSRDAWKSGLQATAYPVKTSLTSKQRGQPLSVQGIMYLQYMHSITHYASTVACDSSACRASTPCWRPVTSF